MTNLLETGIADVPDAEHESVSPTPTPPGPDIAKLLEQRRFDPRVTPPPIRPIYTLGGNVIATPGNLVTITSAAKTGKSAVIAAMAAAAMPHVHDADLLGFESRNPKGLALLHFDSEQSPDDHWRLVSSAAKRAGLREPPSWFYSYCLTGLGCTRAWHCVAEAMRMASERHAGTHSILLDGIADFVGDVNDARESNAFVAELHEMAIKHDCPIVGIIHFNPGGEKVRGHLGSQLERKAETNLRLDKEDGVTCMWSDKQRRAPISKDSGPCFRWSDDAGMHVSTASNEETRDTERLEKLRLLRDEVFGDRPAMRYSDIVSAIQKAEKMSRNTGGRRFNGMRDLGLIEKHGAMLWSRKD